MSNMSVLNPNETGLSPQQKLTRVLRSMGITDFSKAQGTTKTLYDTSTLTAPVSGQKASFFNQNRGLPLTNFPGRFGVMEAMVLEKISFYAQTDDALGTLLPLGGNLGNQEPYYSITIGRDVVCENFPTTCANISSENQADGSSLFTMDFNSLLILPPDTDFKIEMFNINLSGGEFTNAFVKCIVQGTGIELNQKF